MKRLERQEMKNLKGGLTNGGATCMAYLNPSPGVWAVVTGMTYAEASTSNTRPGEHWCCASCGIATWAV